MWTINLLCAGYKVVVKYQAQGGKGGFNPKTFLVYALASDFDKGHTAVIAVWNKVLDMHNVITTEKYKISD